ncbi:MAG: cytidylyltransferase domain-containing protein [Phototrophicaceae bacterium]
MMTQLPYRVFVQARMSSNRLPGKMLAPFRGQPMVKVVLDRLAERIPAQHLVLLTSDLPSDDPLALYVEWLGYAVFRGALDDVLARFQTASMIYPADWVVRVSGDSPLFEPHIITDMLRFTEGRYDLITNVFPRSFPKGNSVEIIRTDTLQQLDTLALTHAEREHVTQVFYNHADQYAIYNHHSGDDTLAEKALTVDTLEDYRRLNRED